MKRLLAGLVLMAAAFGVYAQGFYAGAAFGPSKARSACEGVSGPGISCDDASTAGKLFGGYQVNKNFAAEVGYADLGKVSASGPGGNITVKATALELVGVGSLPVASVFSVYGKLGFFHGQAKTSARTTTLNEDRSDSNNDLTYGFGVRADLHSRVALRLEWQRYPDLGGSVIGKSDVDVFSLGALFKF